MSPDFYLFQHNTADYEMIQNGYMTAICIAKYPNNPTSLDITGGTILLITHSS